jgi:hypothetical protein
MADSPDHNDDPEALVEAAVAGDDVGDVDVDVKDS